MTNATARPLEAGTYDTQGVADLLAVSERHVRNMVKRNAIPGVIRFGRLIRFHKGIVHDWLATQVKGASRS